MPKRSKERIRANKESRPDTVKVEGKVRVPPTPSRWHAHAKAWYQSLKDSASVEFFEPSDWAFALCMGDIYTEGLARSNAAMIGQFVAGSARLLTTEADRRRNRVEVERGKPDSDEHELPKPTLVVSNAG